MLARELAQPFPTVPLDTEALEAAHAFSPSASCPA